MLFLGRFHFKKGIESLLAAWQLLHQRRVCEHWLALVGLGDGGVLTQHLLASPILRTRVIGFLYGEANVSLLSACVRLYVALMQRRSADGGP